MHCTFLRNVLTLVVVQSVFGVSCPPKASTRYGDVEGFKYRMKNGDDAEIFLGIPYASPPMGALRFERPVSVRPWTKTLRTVQYGASCYPHHKDAMSHDLKYDEMCLFLNVMAPSKRSDSLYGYPVIVMIHGGAFEIGSSTFYSYKTLCDNFVDQEVVFVTLNYRLGFLGFLTSGDETLPGNTGLWDQTQALVFISENIAAFGGDPNRVTLMGHSAGAASVTALAISPRSNVYFQQSITFSGSVLCEFSRSDSIINDHLELIKALGCGNSSTKTMKNCMKKLDVEAIMDGVNKIGPSRRWKDSIKFHPMVDGSFLPQTPEKLFSKAPKMVSLVGLSDTECAPLVLDDTKVITDVGIASSLWDSFTADDTSEYIRSIVASKQQYGSRASEFQKQLIEFYVNRDTNQESNASLHFAQAVDALSDAVLNLCLYNEVQQKRVNNWPTYYFVQEYHHKGLHDERHIAGAYHSNEYPYLYGFSSVEDFDFDSDDIAFKNMMLGSLTRFAKTGDPNGSGVDWRPVNDSHHSQYLSMTPNPIMKEEYNPERIHFWTKMVSEDFARNVLSGTQYSPLTASTTGMDHNEL